MSKLQALIDSALAAEKAKSSEQIADLHNLITYVVGEKFLPAAEGAFGIIDGVPYYSFEHNEVIFHIRGHWNSKNDFSQRIVLSYETMSEIITGCSGSGLNDLLTEISVLSADPTPTNPCGPAAQLAKLRKDADRLTTLLGETPREELADHATEAYDLASNLFLDLQEFNL